MASSVEKFLTVTTSEAVTWRKAGTLSTTADTAGLAAAGGRVDGFFEKTVASGAEVSFRLVNAGGTCIATVAGNYGIGDKLYAAASGKLSTTAVGSPVAVLLEDSSADGDEVAVLLLPAEGDGKAKTIEHHTANDTMTNAESGSVHTNKGAAGTITMSLPAAIVGVEFFFYVGAAQQLRLDPNGTETISLPSTGVAGAAGKYLVADAIGETVHLVCCEAGTWAVMGYTGTWTAEA